MIKRREVMNELSKKLVSFCREYEVVVDADWDGFRENDGVCGEWV